jgi:hypothetical protein
VWERERLGGKRELRKEENESYLLAFWRKANSGVNSSSERFSSYNLGLGNISH